MLKILFVCHGNICRSPMAEFVCRHFLNKAGIEGVDIASAALHTDEIGNDIHSGTRRELKAHGIPFAPRAAWLLSPARAAEYDVIFGMDDYNMADLRRLVGRDKTPVCIKLLSLVGSTSSVADPWYTGNFDETYEDIVTACREIVRRLQKNVSVASLTAPFTK